MLLFIIYLINLFASSVAGYHCKAKYNQSVKKDSSAPQEIKE